MSIDKLLVYFNEIKRNVRPELDDPMIMMGWHGSASFCRLIVSPSHHGTGPVNIFLLNNIYEQVKISIIKI